APDLEDRGLVAALAPPDEERCDDDRREDDGPDLDRGLCRGLGLLRGTTLELTELGLDVGPCDLRRGCRCTHARPPFLEGFMKLRNRIAMSTVPTIVIA